MKILIVDDEAVVRVGLKSMINWEENGFELIGEASDGKKALEIIYDTHPDIVITDIRMPVMDGIELMRQIMLLTKSPKVIALSSYDDFQLVKEAMKLGAEDYILKLEMEPEHLIRILEKVRARIKEENENEDKKMSFDRHVRKNLHVMRRNFLRDILSGFYTDEEELRQSMEFLNIQLNAQHVYCMMMKIGEMHRFEEVSDDELHVLNCSIINITEEIVNDSLNGYCFEGKPSEFYILVSSKNGNVEISEKLIMTVAQRLIEMLKQYLDITAVFGVGEGERTIKGIREAYYQATDAVKYRFFKGDKGIILWNDVKECGFQKDEISILNMKERLHRALAFYSKDEIEELSARILKDIFTLPLSPQSVFNVMLELLYMISEFCETNQLNIMDIMNRSYRSYHQLLYIKSIKEAKEWIRMVMEDLICYIKKEEEMDYPRIIVKAKKYIEEHYNEDISLKEVANEVNLNPSYFSTLLKQYIGKSYSEYLTQMRIEKAKVLLQTTQYKVYEVGLKVGYENTYYFNRIFKKITGMSPGEFKNSVKMQ
ncbi:response regulator transcription factor [Petroclostridium xylanilyticum]|uniref:response regulator transcription factor n=1 Tax=Petroclostridium xylanilyticum TaxID=1792311 RepID=UPI0018E33A0C|nr:response regulator [Petroclostridium xylanilyticum]